MPLAPSIRWAEAFCPGHILSLSTTRLWLSNMSTLSTETGSLWGITVGDFRTGCPSHQLTNGIKAQNEKNSAGCSQKSTINHYI